jgi:16S rRNA (guanine1207-N2)-methyltransferase
MLVSEHYYSSKPTTKQEIRQIQAELRGHSLMFRSDSGVFSKKGIDFGSRLLIETVQLAGDERVLDLGCGYGPVGITLAKAFPKIHVWMVDVNERAVALAKENAQLNRVSEQTEIQVSNGFSSLDNLQFDAILCNPPIRAGKALIFDWFANARNYLSTKNGLWIVFGC